MKKNIKRILFMLVAMLTVGAICTACDPDVVDAFADGYRDGYYGNY